MNLKKFSFLIALSLFASLPAWSTDDAQSDSSRDPEWQKVNLENSINEEATVSYTHLTLPTIYSV